MMITTNDAANINTNTNTNSYYSNSIIIIVHSTTITVISTE